MLTILIVVDEAAESNFSSNCNSKQPTELEKIIGIKIYDFLKAEIAPMFEEIVKDIPPSNK